MFLLSDDLATFESSQPSSKGNFFTRKWNGVLRGYNTNKVNHFKREEKNYREALKSPKHKANQQLQDAFKWGVGYSKQKQQKYKSALKNRKWQFKDSP
jgi:hypothetical protein